MLLWTVPHTQPHPRTLKHNNAENIYVIFTSKHFQWDFILNRLQASGTGLTVRNSRLFLWHIFRFRFSESSGAKTILTLVASFEIFNPVNDPIDGSHLSASICGSVWVLIELNSTQADSGGDSWGTIETVSSMSESSIAMTSWFEGLTIWIESSLSSPSSSSSTDTAFWFLSGATVETGFSTVGLMFSPSSSSTPALTVLTDSSLVTCSCCCADTGGEAEMGSSDLSFLTEETEAVGVVGAARFGNVRRSGGSKSGGNRDTGWLTGTWGASNLVETAGALQGSCFTGTDDKESGLMEDVWSGWGRCWLAEAGKAPEEGRGESRGCTAATAAPAGEGAALSAALDSPE